MKLPVKLTLFIALLLNCLVTNPANADLVVDVTGVAGTGTTTWTFSGSSTATSSTGSFVVPVLETTQPSSLSTWDNIGNFTTIDHSTTIPWFTAVGPTVTVGSSTFNINGIYVDHDGGTLDDWTISVDNATDLNIYSGDFVSWTGTTSQNTDISQFFVGTYTASDLGGLSLELNISAVPEPTSLALFGSAGLLFIQRRRRKV